MAFVGADTGQLRELAALMARRADELNGELVSSVSGRLSGTPWKGQDRQQFEDQWNRQLVQLIRKVATALDEAAKLARKNADEQDRTSESDGSLQAGFPLGSKLADQVTSWLEGGASRGKVGTSSGDSANSQPSSGNSGAGDSATGTSSGGGHAALSGGNADPVVKQTSASPSYAAFAAKYQGVHVDYDGAYGAQCVDLANQYVADTFGINAYSVLPGVGYASQIYSSISDSNPYLEKIGAGATPQVGDLVCIGGNSFSPTAGHIAIVNEIRADGSFTVLEQNGSNPGGSAYIRQNPISGGELAAVQGFLRPRAGAIQA